MTWKSREDKEPPPQFFADVVAYLHRSYPNAMLSRALMQELRPFLIAEWRSGQTAHDAAKATCACDGREIVPSPATSVFIPKKSVRPPQGATRGMVYGLDELREPSRLAKLRVGVAMAQRKAEHEESKFAQAEVKLQTARSDGARLRLRSQMDRLLTAAQQHRAEERQLREKLQAELARVGWSLPENAVTAPKETKPRRLRTTLSGSVVPTKALPNKALKEHGKKRCRDCADKSTAVAPASLPPPGGGSVKSMAEFDVEALVNEFAAASAQDRRRG